MVRKPEQGMLVLPARGRWGGKLLDLSCEGSCSVQGESGKENSQRVAGTGWGALPCLLLNCPLRLQPGCCISRYVAPVSPGTQELGKVLGPIPSPPRLGCHRVPGGGTGAAFTEGNAGARSLTVCSGCSRAPGGARGWSSGSRSRLWGERKQGWRGGEAEPWDKEPRAEEANRPQHRPQHAR